LEEIPIVNPLAQWNSINGQQQQPYQVEGNRIMMEKGGRMREHSQE